VWNVAVVDPVTFKEFYKCWKQNEVHIRQVSTLNDFIDPDAEVVIKISQLISCSLGTGHIILTNERQVTSVFVYLCSFLLVNFFYWKRRFCIDNTVCCIEAHFLAVFRQIQN